MTVRLSTGARNAMLGNGSSVGLRGALAGGFLHLYTGTQPSSADNGATGTHLAVVTKDGDGVTGLTFDAAAVGVLSKAAAEVWKFTGLADGVAGWYRFCDSADTPTNSSATAKRIDGTIATAGGDTNMTNPTIATGAVSTVDAFGYVEPAA